MSSPLGSTSRLSGRGGEFGNDLKKGRAKYRWWGPEDGGWYQQPDEAFQPVQELLQRAESRAMEETAYRLSCGR